MGLIEDITRETRTFNESKHRKSRDQFGRRIKSKPRPGTLVYGQGPSPATVMLVGEGPGDDEALEAVWQKLDRDLPDEDLSNWLQVQSGIPFIGASGQELDRHLERTRLWRNCVYVTNLAKRWYDGNPDPSPIEIAEWAPVLEQEIEEVNPSYIGTVGRFSTRYFLGDVDMERVHGIPHKISRPVPGSSFVRTLIIVPIYHPAAGMYSPELGSLVQWDFEQLAKVVEGKIAARPPEDQYPDCDYRELTDDDADYVEWLIDRHVANHAIQGLGRPFIRIAIDTEGLDKRPWGGSFSITPGTGYVFRKHSNRLIRAIFGRIHHHPSLTVLLHNALHDLAVLRDLGLEIPEGQYIDTMVMAYLLCLEPQALKLLGYRLAGMEMSEYLEIVQDADERLSDEYLAKVLDLDIAYHRPDPYTVWVRLGKKLTKAEIAQGHQPGDYVEKTKHPFSLAKRIIGISTDNDRTEGLTDFRKRWHNIDPYVRQAAELELGPMPEATLDDIPLDRAVNYASRDADATGRIFEPLWSRIFAFGLQPTLDMDMAIFPMVEQMQSTGMRIDPGYFANLGYELSIDMRRIQEEIKEESYRQTGKAAFINPDSGDQVSDLLFGQLGMQPLKATKTGRRPSTDDKTLEAIKHLNPVAGLVADYRERSKLKYSFCDVLPRKMDADHIVRTLLRLTRVSSGRLSASGPNLMAIPVRTSLGRKIRRGFIARDGWKLSSFDLDQIEMRIMAIQSMDEVLLELFRQGKDIHKATAAMMFHVALDAVLTWMRYAAKRVGFGVITGIQAAGLLAQMWLNGLTDWTLERCQEAIDNWFRVYAGVEIYIKNCRKEARRYGYVREPHGGRLRYLPGIHSRLKHIAAEAERQSHSHEIQGGAQSVFKFAMKDMWDRTRHLREANLLHFLLQIHDEIVTEHVDDPAVEAEVKEIVVGSMVGIGRTLEFPIPLGAKGSSAYDWGSLKD